MMLVLSRKAGQSIDVGDARITINRVHGGSVQVGIDAPKSIRILRTELETNDETNERKDTESTRITDSEGHPAIPAA